MRLPWTIGLAISVAVVAVLGTATVAFAASPQSAITALAATPRLVYSDEFDGSLDAATWAKLTPWRTQSSPPELQYYDPANVTVSGGRLHLKSENRATNGYSYASGVVTSLNRPKFSYGYFEIRAKLPKGPGIWPAFWLVNDYSFEIDGLEMLGDHPDRVFMILHRNQSEIYQALKEGGPDYSAGFHTYGIDWQPAYVKWYIDGVLCAAYNNPAPPDPMWICLNTAVGGSWPGPPTAATTFPVTYDIDYVRVYDTKPVVNTNSLPVYRFLNRTTNVHFYTASEDEKFNVLDTLSSTYALEGVAYTLDTSAPANDAPLHRFYDLKKGVHFYTASEAEKNNILNTMGSAYRYDGVAYDVSLTPNGAKPVYRFYNLNKGVHFYTADLAERDSVIAQLGSTYRYEGVAFYYHAPAQ